MEWEYPQEVVYTSDYKRKVAFVSSYLQLARDLYHFRALIWQYIRRDFVASYRGTVLGILWKIIMPLVPLSVYIMLHVLGVFSAAPDMMPRALYVVVGMSFWDLWATILSVTVNRLSSQANMLKKFKVPLIVVYVIGLGEILFDTMVRFTLLLALLLVFDMPFQWTWLVIPFLALPFVVFGFGLGIFLSFFAVFTKDVNNMVRIMLRYGLFGSAVIFPLPMKGIVGAVIRCNPMYHLIEGTRRLIVDGQMTNWLGYSICLAVAVCIFAFSLKKACSMEEQLVSAL